MGGCADLTGFITDDKKASHMSRDEAAVSGPEARDRSPPDYILPHFTANREHAA